MEDAWRPEYECWVVDTDVTDTIWVIGLIMAVQMSWKTH